MQLHYIKKIEIPIGGFSYDVSKEGGFIDLIGDSFRIYNADGYILVEISKTVPYIITYMSKEEADKVTNELNIMDLTIPKGFFDEE